MFGINTLKMKKTELELENVELKKIITRINDENKLLVVRADSAEDRVRILAASLNAMENEVGLLRARLESKKYSDDSRDY